MAAGGGDPEPASPGPERPVAPPGGGEGEQSVVGVRTVFADIPLMDLLTDLPLMDPLIGRLIKHFHRRVRVGSVCKGAAQVAFPPPKVAVIRTEPY